MKNKLWIFILFLFTNVSAADVNKNDDLFASANKSFSLGDYVEALDNYQQIEPKTAIVWYNMGNAFYFSERYAYALLCWKRAYKYASFSLIPKIENNIFLLKNKLGLTKQETYYAVLNSYLLYYSSFISILMLQIIFILLWYLLFFYLKYWKRKKNIFLIFALLFLNLFCAYVLYLKYDLYSNKHGIILEKQNMFAGPSEAYHAKSDIPLGAEVRLLNESGDWFKIEYNKMVGWMLSRKEGIKLF